MKVSLILSVIIILKDYCHQFISCKSIKIILYSPGGKSFMWKEFNDAALKSRCCHFLVI